MTSFCLRHPSHASTGFPSSVASFLRSTLYSDVVLHATLDGATARAHACVLAAWATPTLLKILLAAHAAEACEDVHISLANCSKDDLDNLLEFVYGIKKQLREESFKWHHFFTTEPFSNRFRGIKIEKDSFKDSFETVPESYDDDGILEMEEDDKEDVDADFEEDDGDEEEEGGDETEVTPSKKRVSKQNLSSTADKKAQVAKEWNCLIEGCSEKHNFPDLLKHLTRCHQDEELVRARRGVVCELCASSFDTKEAFLVHYHGSDCEGDAIGKFRFSCQECPVAFFGLKNLEAHVNLKHLAPHQSTLSPRWALYYCEICLKIFHQTQLLRSHQSTMHGINSKRKSFAEAFVQAKGLEDQEETNRKEPLVASTLSDGGKPNRVRKNKENTKKSSPYFCKTCEKAFVSRPGFFQHLKVHHQTDSVFECKLCGERYPTKFVLMAHKKSCGRTIPCPLCDKKFASQKSLANHRTTFHSNQVIHEKVLTPDGKVRYKCDLCGGLFSTNQNVHRHKDGVHSSKEGPRKYNCPEEGCGYKTNVLQNYNEHLRVHRPAEHVCERCGGSFISIYNLKKHVTIAHSDGGEEFLCDSCPKTFTNPLSLKRHRQTHGEKNLPCHLCSKQFKSSSNLRQHMLAHTNNRPFVCERCQSGFKTKDKLQRHQKGHCKLSKSMQQGQMMQQPKGQ